MIYISLMYGTFFKVEPCQEAHWQWELFSSCWAALSTVTWLQLWNRSSRYQEQGRWSCSGWDCIVVLSHNFLHLNWQIHKSEEQKCLFWCQWAVHKGWLAIAKLKPLSLFISLLSMPKKAFDNVKQEKWKVKVVSALQQLASPLKQKYLNIRFPLQIGFCCII